MKHTLITIAVILISIASGVWISKNLQVYFFIEEYYTVQNLDPNNEKDADRIRQQIQKLMWTTIPKTYQPDPEKFQCFKIISENVFFCSMDTYRKNVAENVKKLLQETVPQKIGWIPAEEAETKYSELKNEIESDKVLIDDLKKQLDKLKKQNSKRQADEKKFIQTNNLYKKNQDLMERKVQLLKQLIDKADPDSKSQYGLNLEQTESSLAALKEEISEFRGNNKDFAQNAEQQDMLEFQIKEMEAKNQKDEADITALELTLDDPNDMGMVADMSGIQLIPDLNKRKYEALLRPGNMVWFSIFIFFVLTNFVVRIQPRRLASFLDDGTMTEARPQ